MALQPSGSRQVELVSVETQKIYFTIKGKFRTADFDFPEESYADSSFYDCFPPYDAVDVHLYSD